MSASSTESVPSSSVIGSGPGAAKAISFLEKTFPGPRVTFKTFNRRVGALAGFEGSLSVCFPKIAGFIR